MLIVYGKWGQGWTPIKYMACLASRLMEADLIELEYKEPSFLDKLESLILKRKNNSKGEKLLIICSSPTELYLLLQLKNYRKQFSYIAAWIIDSFWMDRIPSFIKYAAFFDHIFTTGNEDIDEWRRIARTTITWLPFSSDVLQLGGNDVQRKWDLTRIGRQPAEWEDDEVTHRICLERQLNFHGRPPALKNPDRNHESLMEIYRQSKFSLSFSNVVNPTSYTHPTRAYLTARWVDALACGCTVVGVSPKEPSIEQILWDGATLELENIDIQQGMNEIEMAVHDWNPDQAKHNYLQSLVRLDWRWRFIEIAKVFNIYPKSLMVEVNLLEQKIDELSR